VAAFEIESTLILPSGPILKFPFCARCYRELRTDPLALLDRVKGTLPGKWRETP